jgi:hypothetical protein
MNKPLKWHRVTDGLVASSTRSARDYKIVRGHEAGIIAPKATTWTAYHRWSPAEPWDVIDWTFRLGGFEGAKWLCQEHEDRAAQAQSD